MKNITLTLISIAHFAFTQAQFSIIEIDYTSDFGGAPSPIAEYNGMVYLRAQVNNMDGLWKTDGTQNGTQLVKQVAPFRFRSVKNGILYNNKFYFYSYQTGASCLWESDGTTNGTKKTSNFDTNPNYVGTNVINCFTALNKLFILWITDVGTTTYSPITVYDGSNFVDITFKKQLYSTDPITHNNKVYFGADRYDIWQSDGTLAGTSKYMTIAQGNQEIVALGTVNGQPLALLRESITDYLYKLDLTAKTVSLIKSFPYYQNTIWDDTYDEVPKIGNKHFFGLKTSTDGRELWVTDLTPNGTLMVNDINTSGDGLGSITDIKVYKGKVYFAGNDGTGEALWSSDGTSSGTQKIKAFPLNVKDAFNGSIIYNGRLYFETCEDSLGDGVEKLWESDGTPQGTKVIATELPGYLQFCDALMYGAFVYKNSLFFTATLNNKGTELWRLGTSPLNVVSLINDMPVSVFPNPSTDFIIFDVSSSDATVRLMDISGAYLTQSVASNNQIDVSHFTKGVYLAEIKSGNQTVVKRWIKM